MQEMTKFTHPIELSGEELDLVAAGGGGRCEGSLVNVEVETGDINILSENNTAVLAQNFRQTS
jgi:hypothetical protein